ncbi:energy transducer TonB [Ideonella sp.]|uniref:energy transducer TonB n=1 Tax=Ideonella sp. TaxID=1929293 RepID=UPI0037C05291
MALSKEAQALVPLFVIGLFLLGFCSLAFAQKDPSYVPPFGLKPQPLKQPRESCLRPQYPQAARRAEIECEVVAAYDVEIDGTISDARIVKSCGNSREHKLLDEAVISAFLGCKAVPGKYSDGAPLKSTGNVMFQWKLE